MALGEIPPWLAVNPADFVRAGSEGASAGLGAAHIAQEASAERDRIGMEAARLSQQEHIAEMEASTRREIADQNRMREDQSMAIQNAYRQSVLGLQKDRLTAAAALTDAKGKAAAMQFADEQGFAQAIAGGKTVPEALALFPRTKAATVNALRLSKENEPGQARVGTLPGGGDTPFLINPHGTAQQLRPRGLTEQQKFAQQREKDRRAYDIRKEINKLERESAGLYGNTKQVQAQRDLFKKQIDDYTEQLKQLGTTNQHWKYDPSAGAIKPADLAAEPSFDEEEQ